MSASMKFNKWIAVGLAIAAILVPVASAKPADSIRLGPGEIPYFVSADRPSIKLGPGEIPYVDDGFSAPNVAPSVGDGGHDVGFGVAGSGVMLLLVGIGGALVAIRHIRKARLSPA